MFRLPHKGHRGDKYDQFEDGAAAVRECRISYYWYYREQASPADLRHINGHLEDFFWRIEPEASP